MGCATDVKRGGKVRRIAIFMILIVFLAAATQAGDKKPVKPAKSDKCPVCGMFVAKYPDFLAQIIFKDGTYAVFDGAKDMFKFYLNPAKFTPGRKASDIDAVYVTDYYSLKPIDGPSALYVVGSDVFGPMGRELIPFEKMSDAEEFKKDHKGTSVLKFRDITPIVLKGLD